MCRLSNLNRMSVPASCLAGCLTRTIRQACVGAQPFLLQAIKSSSFPLTRAHEKKFSRDFIVPETPSAVTYSQTEAINIRTYATVCSFSHNSGFRYANCNVHRFEPTTFNVGSLADGVLAVAPEARLRDRKAGILCIVGCHVVTVH